MASICWLPGCGGENRYNVSGNVTHQGKPVPSGSIVFTQDGQRGGHAIIADGKYDTSDDANLGVMAGTNKVTVRGYELVNQEDPEAPEKPLFKPYETTIEITGSKSGVDFDVP